MASASAQVGVAMASYYPVVTLGGTLGLESSDIANWLSWGSRFWSFGPSLAETVFSGGLRKGQTGQARAAYEAAVAEYRQTVLNGFQEVEDNLSAVRILETEAAVQDEAVKAAQDSLAIALNQHKAGRDRKLPQRHHRPNDGPCTQRTAISILGVRMTSSVGFIRAMGGGWHVGNP
jgi:outer membrane protein TolC